jgi:hypothetical protein
MYSGMGAEGGVQSTRWRKNVKSYIRHNNHCALKAIQICNQVGIPIFGQSDWLGVGAQKRLRLLYQCHSKCVTRPFLLQWIVVWHLTYIKTASTWKALLYSVAFTIKIQGKMHCLLRHHKFNEMSWLRCANFIQFAGYYGELPENNTALSSAKRA